jgi:hypothetical protein
LMFDEAPFEVPRTMRVAKGILSPVALSETTPRMSHD